MEKFTFCLRGGLAKRLERLSTSHGPGYLDYLLETHTPKGDLPLPPPPRPVTDWAPKIGVDDLTKSIEIDVGSQVGGRQRGACSRSGPRWVNVELDSGLGV